MIAVFAETPALPLHTAGKYVAAAYVIFALVIVLYVAIMGARLARNQRELAELRALIAERQPIDEPTPSDSKTDVPERPERVA